MKPLNKADYLRKGDQGALEAEVKRLQAELAWCHEGLTHAHEVCNPGIPAPDWSVVYAALKAAEAAGRSDGHTITEG